MSAPVDQNEDMDVDKNSQAGGFGGADFSFLPKNV
jgi:hypothetical protein